MVAKKITKDYYLRQAHLIAP